MIEAAVGLLMFINGEIKEHRIQDNMASCLRAKREAELFMLVEHMAGLIEGMEEELKNMRNNKVNIDFLKEQVSKLQQDVEKLIRNGNGAH